MEDIRTSSWSDKTVIVAPLNWGLGHAARCVPLIRSLGAGGAKVVLASDGEALHLLQSSFPDLPSFSLPGYGIRYRFRSMALNLAVRAPKLPGVWAGEHLLIRRMAASMGVDCILSDNRPGCYHPEVRSIYLTHQLNVPGDNWATAAVASRIHRLLMRPFHEIWVPDDAESPGLGGALSHGVSFDDRLRYIGPLSRFERPGRRRVVRVKKWRIAVLVSGPEPLRSVWERQILDQLADIPGPHILLRGKPSGNGGDLSGVPETVSVENHLSDDRLRTVLLSSELIVSRCGYSSLMDYDQLGVKALLVPTPGQPEQEYLARKVAAEGRHLVMGQNVLNLQNAIQRMKDFTDT